MTTTTPRPMRVIKKLDPARPDARRWAATYGDALVGVRYRIDPERQERQTTVELIVDRAPTLASLPVGLREENEVRREVKRAGGRWDAAAGLWRLALGDARQVGADGAHRDPYGLAMKAYVHSQCPQWTALCRSLAT